MTVRNMTEGDLDAAFQINELGIDVDLVEQVDTEAVATPFG